MTYTWTFGDGISVTGPTATHTYGAVGEYVVTVTANPVSTHTISTAVTMRDIPIAGLTATNDGPTDLGSSTSFTATIYGGNNVTYAWDFGDGSGGTGASVKHTYDAAGFYTATVTATNGRGNASATTVVTVRDLTQEVGMTLSGVYLSG